MYFFRWHFRFVAAFLPLFRLSRFCPGVEWINIIAETCDIPRDTIKPESHAIDDLGIDSLDFLDIVFAIDKEFGIKIPLEQWTQEVNEGKVSTEEYFVLKNLCAKIDELRAAKG